MPTEGEFRNRLGNAAAGGSPGANLMGFNPPYAKNTTKGKNAKNSMNTTRKIVAPRDASLVSLSLVTTKRERWLSTGR